MFGFCWPFGEELGGHCLGGSRSILVVIIYPIQASPIGKWWQSLKVPDLKTHFFDHGGFSCFIYRHRLRYQPLQVSSCDPVLGPQNWLDTLRVDTTVAIGRWLVVSTFFKALLFHTWLGHLMATWWRPSSLGGFQLACLLLQTSDQLGFKSNNLFGGTASTLKVNRPFIPCKVSYLFTNRWFSREAQESLRTQKNT